jgi:hypothetical protein
MFYASENYCFLKKKALGFLDSLTLGRLAMWRIKEAYTFGLLLNFQTQNQL